MKKDNLTGKEYMNRVYSQINQLINANKISLARKITSEQLKKYPANGILKKYLVNCLLKEKNYEEALILLESDQEEVIVLQLIGLYIKLGNEEKVFELYQKYFQNKNNKYIEHLKKDPKCYQALEVYLKTKYDPNYKLSISDEENHTLRQLHRYNEKEVVDFIETTYHQGHNSKKKRYFLDKIDIEELFNKSQKYISNHLDEGDIYKKIYEKYYFYYPYCGKEKTGEFINSFVVYTMIGTPNIISIMPVNLEKTINTISFEDIDKVVESKEKPLTKTLKPKTGLERFNQKYGIKNN